MNGRDFSIKPVRVWDLPALTQMAYANMTGVDREFTRFALNPLLHALGYLVLPLYLLTSGQGYKAVRDGDIMGCAFLHVRRLSGLVFNVNVNVRYRRRGVGRALMEHLEGEIARKGRKWLGLQVDRDNTAARRLYASLDYRPYNPYFLRTQEQTLLRHATMPGVSVQRLRRRVGYKQFAQYAELERNEGDAWAAAVVKADFDEGPPANGTLFECRFGSREVGCAWRSNDWRQPKILLLLQPEFWPRRTATLELIRALVEETAPRPEVIDVHFGSSKHYEAAMPILKEFGFTQQEQMRLLMLKHVQDEPAASA